MLKLICELQQTTEMLKFVPANNSSLVIDKCRKMLLRSYVRFSTRNPSKIRQDPGSKYMQILVLAMHDHM